MRSGKLAWSTADTVSGISSREAFTFILSYVKRHIFGVTGGVLVLMGVDLIQLIIPRIIQRTIDRLGASTFSGEVILNNTIMILLLASGMVVLRFLWRVLIMGTSRKIEREVREDMFGHLQSMDFSYFNRTQTGHLMALMINDVEAIRMATGPSFLALTDAIFMGTLSLVFLFSISARLTLFSIIPIPFIVFMILRYGPMIQSRFKAVQESFSAISSHAQEAYSGIRVVKGFAQESYEIGEFEKKCDEYVTKNLHLIRIWGFFFPAIALFANLSMAVLYLVGGRAVILRSISFGEFISFSMYLELLIWPVMAIGWVITLFQRGIASSRRILELMHARPAIEDGSWVKSSIVRLEGNIMVRNLTFTYPGVSKPVLKNIDINLPMGSSLGIMGRPGSGKSTLISLFFRLFPFERGNILIDGTDVQDIPLSILRRSIGYVPQEPFLFSDTIANNIAFGLEEGSYTLEDVVRYAEIVNLYDEVMAFEERFDTIVGERGVTLSGGQKQRIAIARALMIKPDILVLDDAFSSVDASTEKIVLRNIQREMEGKTIILVSHRVSTVEFCDTIIVLDDGKIIEKGTHSQLIEAGGYYSMMYRLQQLEEKILG
ncbi:MAG: ABC transporter ATP-binding protein [Spirochaetota bacterium]